MLRGTPPDDPVDNPASLFAQGNMLAQQGQTAAAIDTFRRCVDLAPDHAAASYNLGNALCQAGRPVEAVDAFLACLRHAPDFGAAYVNLAETLRQLGLLEPARDMALSGVHHAPTLPEATICLANVLHDSADYEAAAELYFQALAQAPNHPGALTSLGNTLHIIGRLDESLAAHDRAVAAIPDNADFHFNRAITRLAAGDFTRGWPEYEWRWERPQNQDRGFGRSWCGEDIGSDTVLLHAEQGLGDTLQFVRYAPMVAALGCHVLLEVQPSLVRLLQGSFPGLEVVARGSALPPFTVHCPLLSLPRAFATTLDTIPAELPYLHANPAAAAARRQTLPNDGFLRVGLLWSGSPHDHDAGFHKIDQRRSIPLAAFAPLGELAGIHFVSLLLPGPGRAGTPPPGLNLIDCMAAVTDFADTAALVANLDLVITVDTSVAHLAGAMGKRVWLLSRYDGCWRWLRDRDDSPWYPQMRIYRQQRPHDWSAVIARVRQDLMTFASATERASTRR